MTFEDGHIDPSSVTNAFAAKAKALGGKIQLRSRVQDAASGELQESVVIADFVVNCAGLWCDTVGKMAGIHIPAVVLQHQYLITEAVPEVQKYHKEMGHQLPVLRDLKGSYYLRDERDGILIGPYESKESMKLSFDEWQVTGIPMDKEYYLF